MHANALKCSLKNIISYRCSKCQVTEKSRAYSAFNRVRFVQVFIKKGLGIPNCGAETAQLRSQILPKVKHSGAFCFVQDIPSRTEQILGNIYPFGTNSDFFWNSSRAKKTKLLRGITAVKVADFAHSAAKRNGLFCTRVSAACKTGIGYPYLSRTNRTKTNFFRRKSELKKRK